jgi:hypothetical protein
MEVIWQMPRGKEKLVQVIGDFNWEKIKFLSNEQNGRDFQGTQTHSKKKRCQYQDYDRIAIPYDKTSDPKYTMMDQEIISEDIRLLHLVSRKTARLLLV